MSKTSIAGAVRTAKAQDKKLRNGFEKARTSDSLQNFAAQLGIGVDTLFSASSYGFNPVSRNRILLEWIHRGTWLGGVAIDIVADDMTKMGVELRGDIKPLDIEQLDRAATTWSLWNAINDTIKWSRLYGGCLAVMMIDGQDTSTPLDISRIGKGMFKGLLVLDRWMVEPALNDLVKDLGPDMGLPKYYTVVADAPAIPRMRVHYSRCLRLEGIRLPYWQRLTENLWGLSVIERLFDRMVAFDSATTGMSQLIFKAWLRTYKIKGFREIVAAGGSALTGLVKQIDFMRRTQSTEGITLLDMEDEFATFQHSAFGGLSECILQLGQQISGSLQIPLVRLFGQSPTGMNSSGESDLRTYYDGIKMQQEKTLRVPVTRMYRALAASEGIKLPEGFTIEFRPLWILDDVQKVQTAATLAQTVTQLFESGIISRKTALEEIKQGAKVTSVGTNISDEEIQAAELEPAPALQDLEDRQMQQDQLEAEAAGGDGKTKDSSGTIPQGTSLTAKRDLQFKHPTTGKNHVIKAGSNHWVGNSQHHQQQNGVVEVVKQGKPMGFGLHMRHEQVHEHFHVGDSTKDSILATGDKQINGFPVVIEQTQGEQRYDRTLPAAYGFIRRTGSAEGRDEQMDCFVGPDKDSAKVFIVDSFDSNGRFDEHKVMFHYVAEAAALRDFSIYYFDRRAFIAELSPSALKLWLEIGELNAPFTQPTDVQYNVAPHAQDDVCAHCKFYQSPYCTNQNVARDPHVPAIFAVKTVSPAAWCKEWEKKEISDVQTYPAAIQ